MRFPFKSLKIPGLKWSENMMMRASAGSARRDFNDHKTNVEKMNAIRCGNGVDSPLL